jgi:hypothetical protein
MDVFGRVVVVTGLLAMAGCVSAPRPAPEFHVAVMHTQAVTWDEPTRAPIAIGTIEDTRDLQDRSRIGEIHAPIGVAPVTSGGESADAIAALQMMLLASTKPTGWYVHAKGTDGPALPVERALREALARSGHSTSDSASLRLDGTIRTFWLTPSWTTRCDAAVELRLTDDGNLRWSRTIVVNVDKLVGWFTNEAFEEVVLMAMDQLVSRAAAEFAALELGPRTWPR